MMLDFRRKHTKQMPKSRLGEVPTKEDQRLDHTTKVEVCEVDFTGTFIINFSGSMSTAWIRNRTVNTDQGHDNRQNTPFPIAL
jgi:hypothetical protein